jgi:hypothetical protein
VTDINIGNSSLALHHEEVPKGAITLVLGMHLNKPLMLIQATINNSDFATESVFTAVKNFVKNSLLRKRKLALWGDHQNKNFILAVSIWDGFIKFHDAFETLDQILVETDVEIFSNHLRLGTLLEAFVGERAAQQQVDDLLQEFEHADIVASPDQKKTLVGLINRPRARTSPPRAQESSGENSIFDTDVLKLALTDFALLNGVDGLRLTDEAENPRNLTSKPSTLISIPAEEADTMIKAHTAERPFWYGQFWKDQEIDYHPPNEAVGSAAACIKRISSLPYDEVINATIGFEPKAEPLLRRWREIWDRSFPGWQSLPEWHFDKSEKPTTEHFVHDVDRAFDWAANKSISTTHGIAVFDNWIEDVSDDKRDYRLHVIDDADAVCAMVHLAPGAGFFNAVGVIIEYKGNDDDGYPIFREAEKASRRVKARLDNCPDYWNWPFYKKYLGRRGVVTKDGKHTAAVLADMALQGHSHAFLKGVAQKSGTWTVNLTGITTLESAQQRLSGTLERDDVNEPMYVQEHVPFTHEQRYYVQGGRMFASACSDRNFSVMNTNGRRLDSRVAVLKRPSIDRGFYDRGQTTNVEDRKTSAMFARQVRKIVAELRKYGLQDYSVDMGLTERGMISVEVNTLHMAGPYNMRRELYTKQFERSRKRANDILAQKTCEIIRSYQLPEHIQWKAIAIAMSSDNLVQLSLRFTDASQRRGMSEEGKIAMLITLLAIISTTAHKNHMMTEAA